MADILGSEDYKGICSQKLDEIIYSNILTPAIIDVSQTTLITQDPRRVLRKLENFESDDVNTTKKICSISDNNKHVAHKKATVFRCFAKSVYKNLETNLVHIYCDNPKLQLNPQV